MIITEEEEETSFLDVFFVVAIIIEGRCLYSVKSDIIFNTKSSATHPSKIQDTLLTEKISSRILTRIIITKRIFQIIELFLFTVLATFQPIYGFLQVC